VITVALLATCLVIPGFAGAIDEELDVWNGETVAPADSDGDGVYEINTPEELAWAVNNSGGKSYILTTDIYLNHPDAVNWATGEVNEGFEPREWFENVIFSGTFDGDGHIVYGLYYPIDNNKGHSAGVHVGLFPKVNASTTIKNIGVKSSYIETTGFAGAITGYFGDLNVTGNIAFDNCFSDDTVTVKGYQPSGKNCYTFAASGILGAFYNVNGVSITNCWSNAKTSSINVGGKEDGRNNKIVGDIWLANADWETKYNNLVMKNCYAVGTKPCPAKKQARFSTMENVYSTAAAVATYGPWTQVSEDNMKGVASVYNMPNLGDAYYMTKSTPALKVFNKDYVEGVWTGLRDSHFEGEGTSESPYLVYTPEQLAYAVNT
ncbi:MAG: hypothetical protein UIG59_04840, partial [Acutalibacteraceae bacterium]|nr:hypothetical protein [Acutalibacteraceae bacterium]